MKKKLVAYIILLILLLFSACKHEETYKFLKPIDEISAVSIVEISFSEGGEIIQTEIQIINDINAFFNSFTQISCYTYYGDPTGITEEGVTDTVIKISYFSGEYELINWSGQATYTTDRGFRYYAGYNIFDEDQFDALIAQYL